jgi:hypothetical protein
MLKAFHVMWWNKKDGKESEDLDVVIITDSIGKVVDLFKKEFPDFDPNLITNLEVMMSKVVVE